ncbi:GTP 3',8-cyclase MoaA [Thalassotalea piscium]|uniref:Cyclic pyranopterin phosphate synthase n=1 Tax=Thalassotalea piscium TaxID=1230533 RepID=A0A7X0TS61_9GAMM|nr:GTP 3',8-cyclase MoaA [Thalassotalea piscium]MBB6541813.1 cyclic pyranopterin phosphate synthase [Thalassotalea piscium]
MLTDTYGRKFSYLRLSITDVCNFSCNYCLPDGYQCNSDRDFLTTTEISRIITTFAELGTKKIRITGGEPSLRKDLPEIIAIANQTPGIETVALTSNGYKLFDHINTWLDAGLSSLNISIDSLDPRLFNSITGHNKLPYILKGIDKAFTLGCNNIKVNSVLMKSFNHQHMSYFFDWLKETPVTVRFIELMQTGDNATFFNEQHVSGQNIKNDLLKQGWQLKKRAQTAGPAEEFFHNDYAGSIGLIMPYSKDFCNTCNRLRISALGKLHLCLFAEQGMSLRDLLQLEDNTALKRELIKLLADKKSTHFLHDKLVGATENLAMLGG